ncbi:protein of unknown function, might belong to Alcohol dehydrogenase [Shewanella benthica]|uniref:Uncharacterized protein n=1 Tax=Shewanella benthica TaxID=43661 RepID=A0A330MAS5_9GAMM|nr:protein of unknown function, might belong to Alcohol dehydrogenase [Shewanella benthica]
MDQINEILDDMILGEITGRIVIKMS